MSTGIENPTGRDSRYAGHYYYYYYYFHRPASQPLLSHSACKPDQLTTAWLPVIAATPIYFLFSNSFTQRYWTYFTSIKKQLLFHFNLFVVCGDWFLSRNMTNITNYALNDDVRASNKSINSIGGLKQYNNTLSSKVTK